MSEIEDTLKKLAAAPGVTGSVISNADGIPIKATNLDNAQAVHYSSQIHALVNKARASIQDMDPSNDVTFIRIRTKKDEWMIAPEKDYTMTVIQDPNASK